MGGTIEGARKAMITIKKWHGDDFHARIGKLGGAASGTGGFYNNPELARRAGKLGGKRSTRAGVKTGQGMSYSAVRRRAMKGDQNV